MLRNIVRYISQCCLRSIPLRGLVRPAVKWSTKPYRSTCFSLAHQITFIEFIHVLAALVVLCLPTMLPTAFNVGQAGPMARDPDSQVMSPTSLQHGTGEKDTKFVGGGGSSVPTTDVVRGLPVVFGGAVSQSMASTTSIPMASGAPSTASIGAAAVQASAAPSHRESGSTSTSPTVDDITPRRKRSQGALPAPLPEPAATKRSGSLPPTLPSSAQSSGNVCSAVALQTGTGSAVHRGFSPGDMPAPYQEALQNAASAIWAHANEHCLKEKVRIAEMYAGKHREWEASRRWLRMHRRFKSLLKLVK